MSQGKPVVRRCWATCRDDSVEYDFFSSALDKGQAEKCVLTGEQMVHLTIVPTQQHRRLHRDLREMKAKNKALAVTNERLRQRVRDLEGN